MSKIEIIVAVLFVALAVVCFNPTNLFMPGPLLMGLTAALAATAVVLSITVWRAAATDERDVLHQLIAGRVAYIAGALVLAAGVIVQTFAHAVDRWLVAAIVVMVVARLAGLVYGRLKK